jgi:ABC-2 type transport system ATP-binding protein
MLALMMRGKSRSEARQKAQRVIDTLELTEYAKVHSEELPGGLRQRILIAMTIACDAELIFLDEPTIGLDPVGRRRVWNELIRLKREEGRTVVLTTHYMDEAEALSDELAIIHRGKVLAKGTPADIRSSHLSSTIRVDVSSGFSESELESYGRVARAGNILRLFVGEETAEEISREALRRKATISIAPITLDDVFVDIVGSSIEDETPHSEPRRTAG